jgi:hypothetical protein
MLIPLKNLPSIRNLEGRCLQRLEASETPLGAASDSPPFAIRQGGADYRLGRNVDRPGFVASRFTPANEIMQKNVLPPWDFR